MIKDKAQLKIHLLTTKQWGQRPPEDKHAKQEASNRLRCRAGNTIVRALSTFGGRSWWPLGFMVLKFTIGDLAKLAGDIQTKGPGKLPPGGLPSCTGKLIDEGASPLFPVRFIDWKGCEGWCRCWDAETGPAFRALGSALLLLRMFTFFCEFVCSILAPLLKLMLTEKRIKEMWLNHFGSQWHLHDYSWIIPWTQIHWPMTILEDWCSE